MARAGLPIRQIRGVRQRCPHDDESSERRVAREPVQGQWREKVRGHIWRVFWGREVEFVAVVWY